MKDNDNFIPRHGSPLFYPQDPSEGFQGGAGGLSRRKFLKRTGGATAGAFLSWGALSRQARADYAKPPEHMSDYIKEFRYRLKCTVAPNPNDGSASWTEVASVNGAAEPRNITLSNTGPSQGDVGLIFLEKIEGVFTTSLVAGEFKESSQATLGFIKNPFDGLGLDEYVALQNQIAAGEAPRNEYFIYDGDWISSTSTQPDLFYADSGEVGTPVGASFHMCVACPRSLSQLL
jgi:hypothetical protein